MVRFQSVAYLGLVTYAGVDAFAPSAFNKPTRIDSSLWYLDPADLPMSTYGGLVVGNTTTAPVAPYQPQTEQVMDVGGELGKHNVQWNAF
jgi:hypothetical protein